MRRPVGALGVFPSEGTFREQYIWAVRRVKESCEEAEAGFDKLTDDLTIVHVADFSLAMAAVMNLLSESFLRQRATRHG